MPSIDLKTDEGLKAACAEVRTRFDPDQGRESALRPRPAADRIRTLPLSGRGNRFELVKRVVALIGERVALSALIDNMLAERMNPNAPNAGHCLRAIRTSLCLIDIRDQYVHITPSGRALRETGDPDSLRDRMLTGLLGFDHLLVWMSAAPRPKRWLLDELRKVNRGWTKNDYPRALINWTRWLGLSVKTDDIFTLTERGRAWRSLIHWNPEPLP